VVYNRVIEIKYRNIFFHLLFLSYLTDTGQVVCRADDVSTYEGQTVLRRTDRTTMAKTMQYYEQNFIIRLWIPVSLTTYASHKFSSVYFRNMYITSN